MKGASAKLSATASGAIAAAFGSSVCCAGPAVAAAIGVSGAALSGLLPYRPFFVFAAGGFLYLGFHLLDKEEKKACDADEPCASPAVRRRMRRTMWIATGLVALFTTSPLWIDWVL